MFSFILINTISIMETEKKGFFSIKISFSLSLETMSASASMFGCQEKTRESETFSSVTNGSWLYLEGGDRRWAWWRWIYHLREERWIASGQNENIFSLTNHNQLSYQNRSFIIRHSNWSKSKSCVASLSLFLSYSVPKLIRTRLIWFYPLLFLNMYVCVCKCMYICVTQGFPPSSSFSLSHLEPD